MSLKCLILVNIYESPRRLGRIKGLFSKRLMIKFQRGQRGKHKEEGGLGFRDLHSFNDAKQGWRLLKQPSSLASKTFKAKYFLNDSFLKALLGKNPSFLDYYPSASWNLNNLRIRRGRLFNSLATFKRSCNLVASSLHDSILPCGTEVIHSLIIPLG